MAIAAAVRLSSIMLLLLLLLSLSYIIILYYYNIIYAGTYRWLSSVGTGRRAARATLILKVRYIILLRWCWCRYLGRVRTRLARRSPAESEQRQRPLSGNLLLLLFYFSLSLLLHYNIIVRHDIIPVRAYTTAGGSPGVPKITIHH